MTAEHKLLQWRTSNHVLTRTDIHKHTERKSLDPSCKIFSQKGAVATTSWRLKNKANYVAHTLTLHRGNLQHTCATTLIVPLLLEFTRIARNMFAIMALDQTPQRGTKYKSDTNSINALTKTENLKHTDQKFAGLSIRTFGTPHIVVTTSWRPRS